LEINEPRRLILSSLILSVSSIDVPSLIVGISLIEIAASFGVSISLAGQIRSVTSILAIIVSILMGALSVRYDYKSILVTGLLINICSAILCAIAPSFTLMLLCFSVVGIVTSLVAPMVFSYIGEVYESEERPHIVGLVASTRTVSYLLMVQLIGMVLAWRGWRYAFLLLVVPLTLVAVFLSNRTLPAIRKEEKDGANILEGYRSVLGSKSALSCLSGNMLAGGAWAGGIVTYSVTYLREGLQLGMANASGIFSGLVIGVLVGNYLGGIIAGRTGTKVLIVVSSLITGLLIFGYMGLVNPIAVTAIAIIMSITAGIILTCANTLIINQVPQYRGTVTSLNTAITQLGVAIGAALGGLVLDISSWGSVGVIYGLMHLVAAVIYFVGIENSDGASGGI
jgi:predicted MFS family arabinose efflux permease